MSANKNLDLSTLAKISRGVDDVNGNGFFDEGDILKGYYGGCGAAAKDACGCRFWDGDFVLTPNDMKSNADLEQFLYRALHREVKFFSAENRDGDDQYYAAISQRGCNSYDLEYVIRIKGSMGHAQVDANGYLQKDVFIYNVGPEVNMATWLSSADKYLGMMD